MELLITLFESIGKVGPQKLKEIFFTLGYKLEMEVSPRNFLLLNKLGWVF